MTRAMFKLESKYYQWIANVKETKVVLQVCIDCCRQLCWFAVAMGGHLRLGRDSPLLRIDPFMLKQIADASF